MSDRVTQGNRSALGYSAEIPQAFWRRVTRYHMPVRWFACWLALTVMQFVLGFTQIPAPWQVVFVGGGAMALGELMALQWLTWADPYWDSLVTQRDCIYYEAD